MEIGLLTAAKHGNFGGKLTTEALRNLKQVGKYNALGFPVDS
jgi:hypothetical protein